MDPDKIGLIINAGANAGCAALYFAHHYPNAAIVALEPEKSNFQILKSNVASYPSIVALERGLWWREAKVKLTNPDSERWGFSFVETTGQGVDCITLPTLLKEHHRSGRVLVKIDIEGAESDLFQGDSSWLKQVDYIFIEIHKGWKRIFDALALQDYEAWISSENVVVRIIKN